MDEPNPYARAAPPTTPQAQWVRWLVRFMTAYGALTSCLLIAGFVALAVKYPLVWILVAPGILAMAVQLLLPRFRETQQAKAMRIQRRAREQLGADLVGSAIHTAGHPALRVDQPVLLALKDGELSILGYEAPTVLDTLSARDFQAVDLITFDDDDRPRIGVIDSSAQALQITFQRQGVSWACSFRRMYQVRPIEWYQALQKARVGAAN